MSVAEEVARVQYAGSGSTGPFAFNFKLFDEEHITVVKTVSGVDSTLTLTTDYSVTLAADFASATVTLVVALASGETLTLVRDPPLSQAISWPRNDPFPSTTHERAADLAVMLLQRLEEKLGRSLVLREGSSVSGLVFPDPLADAIPGWNSAGTALENKTLTSLGSVLMPASTTDNALIKADGTSGANYQATSIIISDSDDVSGVRNFTLSGYPDLAEIAEPSSPAANVARLFSRDVSGRTELAFKTNAGQVVDMLRGLVTVKDYGAVGDATVVSSGCAITSSDNTLTAPASTFTSADAGKAISVLGAGAAGANLITTIASFTNDGEVELTDAASTTVASASIVFGTDDTSAFNTAIAAKSHVLVPRGSYITTDRIVFPSSKKLQGLFKPTIYALVDSESAIAIADIATLTNANRVYDLGLENFQIDGRGSNSSVGLDLSQVSSGIIRDVTAFTFSTGIRLRGIAYYNRLEYVRSNGCTLGWHIHNDSADLSGPNHNTLIGARSNSDTNGFLIEDDGSTNLNDLVLIHPAVESLATSGVAFDISADNLMRSVTFYTPRIDVSNGSCIGFRFNDIGNTDRVIIHNPNLEGLATDFSPAANATSYQDRVRILATDKTDRMPRDWQVIAASAVAAAHTGDTNETALATITIPGGSMGANGVLRITATWSMTNSANSKTIRYRLGGIGGSALRTYGFTTTGSYRESIMIANRNSEASQLGGPPGTSVPGGFGLTSGAFVTGTVNTANDQDFVISGQLANSGETITLESYTVELLAQD